MMKVNKIYSAVKYFVIKTILLSVDFFVFSLKPLLQVGNNYCHKILKPFCPFEAFCVIKVFIAVFKLLKAFFFASLSILIVCYYLLINLFIFIFIFFFSGGGGGGGGGGQMKRTKR